MLTYDLEARGKLSRYEYLYRCIRDDIEHGSIAANGRLPSKRSLAAHLGVSVITIEQAYDQLVAEGYLYARPRSGYFASELAQAVRSETISAGRPPRWTADDEPGLEHEPDPEPAVADFVHGAPFNDRAFELWARALRRTAATENPSEAFGGLPPKGSLRLRRAIAHHLEGSRGMAVEPADVVVGAGSQLLYGLLVQLLGRRGPYAVEDPGYPALTAIYRAQGAEVRHVPLDAQGISAKALELSGARIAHVMPSHQYPTGIVTSIGRRHELLSWASEGEGRYIVEDDYDSELRLAGRPVPALAGIDASDKVVYVNTFARSISPTLRVAYMVLPASLSARFDEELGFYSNTVSAFAQVALARLIEDGSYERVVNRQRTAYRALRDRLADAVRAVAPSGALSLEQADSGLHCVLSAATSRDEGDVAAAAREQGVAVSPLSGFCLVAENYGRFQSACGDARRARFMLNYAGVPADRFEQALAVVARSCAVT